MNIYENVQKRHEGYEEHKGHESGSFQPFQKQVTFSNNNLGLDDVFHKSSCLEGKPSLGKQAALDKNITLDGNGVLGKQDVLDKQSVLGRQAALNKHDTLSKGAKLGNQVSLNKQSGLVSSANSAGSDSQGVFGEKATPSEAMPGCPMQDLFLEILKQGGFSFDKFLNTNKEQLEGKGNINVVANSNVGSAAAKNGNDNVMNIAESFSNVNSANSAGSDCYVSNASDDVAGDFDALSSYNTKDAIANNGNKEGEKDQEKNLHEQVEKLRKLKVEQERKSAAEKQKAYELELKQKRDCEKAREQYDSYFKQEEQAGLIAQQEYDKMRIEKEMEQAYAQAEAQPCAQPEAQPQIQQQEQPQLNSLFQQQAQFQMQPQKQVKRPEPKPAKPVQLKTPLISVVSASGGTGRSTIALLSAFLAARSGLSTVLIEGDLQFGDYAFWLNLDDDCSSLGDENVEALQIAENLRLYKAPLLPEVAEEVSDDVAALLPKMIEGADIVFADTGGFWNGLTANLLLASELFLMVVDKRPSSLMEAVKAVELCTRIGVPSLRMAAVYNRYSSRVRIEKKDACEVLDTSEIYCIPEGKQIVEDLLSKGDISELIASENPVVLGIDKLLAEILPRVGCDYTEMRYDSRRFLKGRI